MTTNNLHLLLQLKALLQTYPSFEKGLNTQIASPSMDEAVDIALHILFRIQNQFPGFYEEYRKQEDELFNDLKIIDYPKALGMLGRLYPIQQVRLRDHTKILQQLWNDLLAEEDGKGNLNKSLASSNAYNLFLQLNNVIMEAGESDVEADDRTDLSQIESVLIQYFGKEALSPERNFYKTKQNWRATAVMVHCENIRAHPEDHLLVLKSKPLKQLKWRKYKNKSICPGERYADNQAFPNLGTAFFIYNEYLATAGHCLRQILRPLEFLQLKDIRFILNVDKELPYDESVGGFVIDKKFVFRSVETELNALSYAANEVADEMNDPDGLGCGDWAVIRVKPLCEKYGAVSPAKIYGMSRNIKKKDEVYCIGHGLGIHKLFAYDGYVSESKEKKTHFRTTLDLFSGNSGSPIFNSRHEAIGLLGGGGWDFYETDTCLKINVTLDTKEHWFHQTCQRINPVDYIYHHKIKKIEL